MKITKSLFFIVSILLFVTNCGEESDKGKTVIYCVGCQPSTSTNHRTTTNTNSGTGSTTNTASQSNSGYRTGSSGVSINTGNETINVYIRECFSCTPEEARTIVRNTDYTICPSADHFCYEYGYEYCTCGAITSWSPQVGCPAGCEIFDAYCVAHGDAGLYPNMKLIGGDNAE